MVRRRSNRVIYLIWERMNYAQKRAIYRFVTGCPCPYNESTLNTWWFHLPCDDRCFILYSLDSFLESLHEKRI